MRNKGNGNDAGRKPQCLPSKSEVTTGGKNSDHPRGTWPDGSSMTLCTETEVLGRGELDVDNVEGEETYLRTGILHLRDNMVRILHDMPTGS